MRVFLRFPKKIEMFLLLIYELQTDIYGERKIEMNCGQQSRQQTDNKKGNMEQLLKNVGVCLDMGEDGSATAYGEWDEERRADFISSILGGGNKKKAQEVHTCCMCEEKYKGFGNNARPVYEGRCCDGCNLVVLNCRAGAFRPESFTEMFELFPSQKKYVYRDLKTLFKTAHKGQHINIKEVLLAGMKRREREEEKQRKDWVDRMERHMRMVEENKRLEALEEERKARDEEETKKRQEDFEMRVKALEVKEAQRKVEEKREKEERAKKAEEKKAQREAERAEKQKKFEGKRK